jgi:hypothetical protein
VPIYPDHVPPTSILREFIGASGFEYWSAGSHQTGLTLAAPGGTRMLRMQLHRIGAQRKQGNPCERASTYRELGSPFVGLHEQDHGRRRNRADASRKRGERHPLVEISRRPPPSQPPEEEHCDNPDD